MTVVDWSSEQEEILRQWVSSFTRAHLAGLLMAEDLAADICATNEEHAKRAVQRADILLVELAKEMP